MTAKDGAGPRRIQRKRMKAWKAPEGTLMATRPGEFGNPFRVGGYFKLGDGRSGMAWLEALSMEFADPTFTRIETAQEAVEMFREYRKRYPFRPDQIEKSRSASYIACYCPLNKPCHVDVLLEITHG